MKVKEVASALLATAGLVLGMSVVPGGSQPPANAAIASPACSGIGCVYGPYHMHLDANKRVCANSQGVRRQLDLSSGCNTRFTFKLQVINGNNHNVYFIRTRTGKCVRETSSRVVRLESTGCHEYDFNEYWEQWAAGDGSFYWINEGVNDVAPVVNCVNPGCLLYGGSNPAQHTDWVLTR